MISLLLSLMLCMTSCKAPVSDSFVEAYKMYEKKHYNRFHRLARRHTVGHPIKKKDSLIFIPFLTISKEVRNEWDWNLNRKLDTVFNNAKYASWEYLDYKRRPDKFLVYADNKCVKLYSNGAIGRKKRRFGTGRKELLEIVTQYKPDGVFTVCYVPGWFFIIGEDIVHIKLKAQGQGLIYREDALEVLKDSFTARDFWPIFTGQER